MDVWKSFGSLIYTTFVLVVAAKFPREDAEKRIKWGKYEARCLGGEVPLRWSHHYRFSRVSTAFPSILMFGFRRFLKHILK